MKKSKIFLNTLLATSSIGFSNYTYFDISKL